MIDCSEFTSFLAPSYRTTVQTNDHFTSRAQKRKVAHPGDVKAHLPSDTRHLISIPQTSLLFGIVLIFVLAVAPKPSMAGCYVPSGPITTERTLWGVPSQTHHLYAAGVRLCIFSFNSGEPNKCTTCKRGYWHRCDGYGRWRPEVAQCTSAQAHPYINGVTQTRSDSGGQGQPSPNLCRTLGTC